MLDLDETVVLFVILCFFLCLFMLESLRLGGWS